MVRRRFTEAAAQNFCLPDTFCGSPTEMASTPLPNSSAAKNEAFPKTPPVPIRQSSAPAATTMERSYSLPVATQREFESQWQSVAQRTSRMDSLSSLPERRSVAPPQTLCLSEDTTCTYSSLVSSSQESAEESAVLCNSLDCWWSYGWPSCGNGTAIVSPVRATHTPLTPPSLEDETESLADSVQSHSRKHVSWMLTSLENELSALRSCKTPPPTTDDKFGHNYARETSKPAKEDGATSPVDVQPWPCMPASSLSESMSKHAWTLAAATQKRFFPPITCETSCAWTPAMTAKSMGMPEPLSFYIHPDHVQ
ncbi:hypothetical protein MEQU1_000946 [Malassezia equina]|uniref:Uncharacterized protein n=1 Tax=Malassezia equina TaxID=1381935 RepID=A0AAF0ECZ9_9BASI|nr:hypothetical protein MEQU1_000946 [Malassezia equina]